MKRLRLFQTAVILSLAAARLVLAADAPERPQPTIEQLIARLGSDDFDERNAATEKLASLGEIARESLAKAAAGKDPDIRIAATDLLTRLGQTSLSFLVVDRDGKPIAGAQGELTLTPSEEATDETLPQKITTREDGIAMVGKVQPGTYDVSLQWARYSANPVEGTPERVRLLPGANRIVVILSQGGTVQATALDGEGKPLKGAQLALGSQSALTDGEGKVRIDNVPDGNYRAAWKVDTQSIDGVYVHVAEGKVTELPPAKLAVNAPATLKLTLQKADGEPLAKSNSFVTLSLLTSNPDTEWQNLLLDSQKWLTSHYEPTHHTDENGKLSVENLEPGKYGLLIRDLETVPETNGTTPPWQTNDAGVRLYCVDELELKSGAVSELTLKPIDGGTLKGSVLLDDGKPQSNASLALIPEKYVALQQLQAVPDFDDVDYVWPSARTGADGTFEMKHLAPGKYMLAARNTQGRTYVFGIGVTDGKTTEVPAISIATPKGLTGELKGKVLLPNGKPCADADLVITTSVAASQMSASTGENGTFSFDLADTLGTLHQLKVTAEGFQTQVLDLHAPGLDLQNIIIQLKQQGFGGVHIMTLDDAGKPLAGVRVWPGGTNPDGKLHLKQSDAKGEVVFTGLAAGAREFKVEKTGYIAGPAAATIAEGKDEATASVTLHPGLKITGRVELPPNVPNVLTSSIGVVLTEVATDTDTWTTLNSNAEFAFSGLAPGEYLASAVAGGCVLDGAPQQISIADQKAVTTLTLRMVGRGAAAINLGPSAAGRRLKLMPADIFANFDRLWYWEALENTTIVDGNGRVEFTGAPGVYTPFVLDEFAGELLQRTIVSAHATAPVTFQPIKLTADVDALPDTPVTVTSGTGTVAVSLTPVFPDGVRREYLASVVDVLLVGRQTITSIAFMTPNPVAARIVGTPPADLQIDHQRYTARNLPADDYKLIVIVQDEHGQAIGQKLLAERSLKDGESLDLGEVKIPIPKVTTAVDEDDIDQPDPDKDENFKP